MTPEAGSAPESGQESAQDPPRISLHDHLDHCRLGTGDLDQLADTLRRALPLILACPGDDLSVLASLPEIEISLLDDSALARIHGDFLDDPSPTDVITFQHGEILLSLETAEREAAARGHHRLREAALYAIHGLLHLHGHTDARPTARTTMHAAQDRILSSVWPPPADH